MFIELKYNIKLRLENKSFKEKQIKVDISPVKK